MGKVASNKYQVEGREESSLTLALIFIRIICSEDHFLSFTEEDSRGLSRSQGWFFY